MRGDNWDGTPVDTSDAIQPVIDAMLAKQDDQGLTMRQVCRRLGVCQSWLGELVKHQANGRLGRLCRWAREIRVQELGVFVILNGEYTACALHDIDEPKPWTFSEGGRQVPDFRDALKPVRDVLKRRRRELYPTAEDFAKTLGVSRNIVAGLESGEKTRSPTAGALANWARHLGADGFGVYVVIDGSYTEAHLLGDDNG